MRIAWQPNLFRALNSAGIREHNTAQSVKQIFDHFSRFFSFHKIFRFPFSCTTNQISILIENELPSKNLTSCVFNE